LKNVEGNTASGGIEFTLFKESETAKLMKLLAEPSLLGLDIDQSDLSLISSGLEKVEEIAVLLDRKPQNKSQLMDLVQKDIFEQQRAFFEKISSVYDMYWHFSPFGLDIIESNALCPAEVTGNRMTAEHSKSLHFIKPGFFGQESAWDYTGYAQSVVRNGSGGDKRISEPFGIAVIYPLGEIARDLPYRDEPIISDRTSEDVVFRESDTYEPHQSLPLEEAFILPMQTMEQLEHLRTNPDYQDIFTEDWQPIEELAEKVTRRALQLKGYDNAWIDKHVLPTLDSSKGAPNVDEVYKITSEQIRARLPENHEIIVPLAAKRGGFETHDKHTTAKSSWRERLIRLETRNNK
jgi:hypothetical protein